MTKHILMTPIKDEDINALKVGDIVYLTGIMVTCRDVAHRRLIEHGRELPVNLEGGAILHAGPIVKQMDDQHYEMISIGPTTSMRMEKFEKEFIAQTGVKLIIGKGGMGAQTQAACKEHKALHLVYPAGNAVFAATKVKRIVDAQWTDLGMPETLWVCEVEEFGPLIVSIDTEGRNVFEENKIRYNARKEEVYQNIIKEVGFIK
ncbi:L(+)-tartrate dehydratase subunit beta [Oligella ureolytica]|uniref:L(+)-tartrate dehydratase subunit beta n=1 Tax=Oligella ureolytica TaxID=90244 RepID=A0A378XH40_9BURK|nr:L(+)-tartrate dehydratase subunit beta [Oligella ureolytica]QPT39571.1 L(+)-tartrate dehydratase subunit beta [Oligella ureolytica]SUA56736.1 L(+)-tartrate dehydratase subunit beta [Oligella ureolytica]